VAISQHYLPTHNERDNEELITRVARQPGGPLGSCKCSYARDHGLGACSYVEVSGPCGTASNTLRPRRLPIHIWSAGERARPPVQSFFVPGQMNRTEPNRARDGVQSLLLLRSFSTRTATISINWWRTPDARRKDVIGKLMCGHTNRKAARRC
jgi:hypothetical protein